MKLILSINPTASNEYFRKRMMDFNLGILAFFTHIDLPIYSIDSLKEEYYFSKIISTGDMYSDIETIKSAVNDHKLVNGFIGSEVDFEYAEKILSKLFPLESNDPNTSTLRYKKFEMNKALHDSNISAVRQILISAHTPFQDIINKLESYFDLFKTQIILKPNHGSAASKGVSIACSYSEIKEYFEGDNFGLFYHTDEIVVQELAVGDEYFVDSYSFDKIHYFSSVFKYKKHVSDGNIIMRYKDIIFDESIVAIEAKKYVQQCLDALDVRYGFSHTELILTKDGFKLVEVNPRISGGQGMANFISKLKYNIDQFDIFSQIHLNKYLIKNSYNFKYYRCVNLYNYYDYDSFDIDLLHSLLSFKLLKILKTHGKASKPTSLIDTIALVLLEHGDLLQIENDTKILIELEKEGKFLINSKC